jgi:sugar (pentulose or hexulose) kinase
MSHAVGLDIGSTWVKAVAVAADGELLASVRRSTPWCSVGDGGTQMSAGELVATVRDLLDALDVELGGREVRSIGVSGMAEAGVLLDGDGRPAVPVPAWFDPRGAAEFAAQPAALRAEFPRRTGLPVSGLATFAKLLHHRAGGLDLNGLTWLNVPEYVAHVLGGDRYGEVSLVARTGLVDQDTGRPWQGVLDALGVGPELLPPTLGAGADWGRADAVAPPSMRGAVLTVAGHDHLVASVAAGVVRADQLYDSIGTAEALVRVLERPLDPAARGELAAEGVNVVRHMLPGRWTMLAGTRGGLVLRRVLRLAGINDDAGRDALDAEVMALPEAVGAIDVSGAANTSSTLTVRVDTDDVSPARLFAAALAHGTETLRDVVSVMDSRVGPAVETVVAGGWARMAAVRRARAAALPRVRFSARPEDTAFGAALVGRFAAEPAEHDLVDFVSRALMPPAHSRTGGDPA